MNDKGERPALTPKSWGTPLCALLKGGIMAGGAAVLLLLGSAFLLSAGVFREEWAEGIVSAVCVFSGFCGGLYSVSRLPGRPLAAGLGVGGILCALLLLAGGLAWGGPALGMDQAKHLCACLCGGAMAGILGAPRKKKRKKPAARARREG